MDDPVTALIGTLLIAFGTTILFGAIKNKKVLGANGIIPTALTTGSLANLDKVPAAYPPLGGLDLNKIKGGSIIPTPIDTGNWIVGQLADAWKVLTGEETVVWLPPKEVVEATVAIEQKASTVGVGIAKELSLLTPTSSLNRLRVLLAQADANGAKTEAEVIREYIRQRQTRGVI